jgi:hypothetical protein
MVSQQRDFGEIEMSRLTLASTLLALAALPGWATAQGLTVSESAWSLPRVQARIGLTMAQPTDGQAPSSQQVSVLLGDYYFSRARLGISDVSSGFRATSGVWLGQRSIALGMPALAGSQSLSASARSVRTLDPATEPWSAVPYLGVGWSGTSLRGGWGVTADFGFAARPATGLRPSNAQGLDDLLRELRLTPVLHLGVSYAF